MVSEAGSVMVEGRAAERRPAMAPSTMRANGTAPVDVMVLDVSATGVRIATSAMLEVGQEISIGLGGAGSTRAFVAWSRDGQYGCRFERALEAEGAAKAFSRSEVVHLGRSTAVQAPGGPDPLRDLWLHHRAWHMPLDAILVFVIEAAVVGAILGWLFGN